MGKVGELRAEMTASNKGFSATIENAKDQLKDMKQAAEEMSKSVRDLGIASAAAFAAVAAATTQAVKASLELNAAMASVGTMIPQQSARLQELKREVQGLAIEVGKSTDDLAQGLYNVISAFGDAEDSVRKLEISAKAATAGVATTNDALNFLSAVTKAYGDTSAEAMEHVADLGFQTLKLGQTSFPELANSIGRVTPLAVNLGISMEELFGVFATGTGVTGGAAEVSTQLAGVLQALSNPTESMTKLFEAMGVASGEAAVAQYGLQGVIQAVADAAKASGQPINDYIGSIRGQTLALTLAGAQADTFIDKTDAMYDSMGAMQTAFEEQAYGVNAVGFALKQLQQEWEVTKQSWGDAVQPSKEMVQILRDLIHELGEWARDNPELARTIVYVATAVTGVTAAATAFVALKPLIIGTMAALTTPTGGAILAIGALAGVVAGLGSKQKETARDMYNLGQKAKDQADQLERLTGQYRDLEGKTNKSAEEHEELRKIMDQIAELAPELVTGYDDMGQAILDMGDAADRAVERLREMHEVQIEAAKLDVSLNLPRLQQEFAATVDEMNWIQTRVQLVLKELETAKGIYKKNLEDQLKVEQQMLSAQSKKLDSLREEIKTYEDLQEAIRKYEAGETGTRTPTKSKPSTDLGVSIGDGKTTSVNEALKKQLEIFADLKAVNSDLVDTHQKQAEWLEKNILKNKEITLDTQERAGIEDMIFRIMLDRYNHIAERDGWLVEHRLNNLDDYVKAYARSTDHMMAVDSMRIRLKAQAAEKDARAKDKAFSEAMDAYDLETRGLELSAQERKDIYERIMAEKLDIDKRSVEASKAIATQLIFLDREIAQEAIDNAKKSAQIAADVRLQVLRNSGQELEAEIEEIKRKWAPWLEDAAGDDELYKERYMQMLREIDNATQASNQRRLDHEKDLHIQELELLGMTLQAELQAIERERQEELRLAEQTGADKARVNRVYDLKAKEAEEKHAAKKARMNDELNKELIRQSGNLWRLERQLEVERHQEFLDNNDLALEQWLKAHEVHKNNLAEIDERYLGEQKRLAQEAADNRAAISQSELEREIAAIEARGEAEKKAALEAAVAAHGREEALRDPTYLWTVGDIEKRVASEIAEVKRKATVDAEIAQAELDAFWLEAIGAAEDAALANLKASWLKRREEYREDADALLKIDTAYYVQQADIQAYYTDERLRREQEAADALLELRIQTLEAQGKAEAAARARLDAERDQKLRDRPEGVDPATWTAEVEVWYQAGLAELEREATEKRAQIVAEANRLLAEAMTEGLEAELLKIDTAWQDALEAAEGVPEAIEAINNAYNKLRTDAILNWTNTQTEAMRKAADQQKQLVKDQAEFNRELAESIADIYRTAEEQAIASLDEQERREKEQAEALGILAESWVDIEEKYNTLRQQVREQFQQEHLMQMSQYNAEQLRAQGRAKEAELEELWIWLNDELDAVAGNKELEAEVWQTYEIKRQEIVDRYNREFMERQKQAAKELELAQKEGLDRRLADLDYAMEQELKAVETGSQAEADIIAKYDILKQQERDRYDRDRELAQMDLEARLLEAQGNYEAAALKQEELRYQQELDSQEWTQEQKEELLRIHEANKANIKNEWAVRRWQIDQKYTQLIEQLDMTARERELARLKQAEEDALDEARKVGADEVKIRQYYAELRNQVDERYEQDRRKRLAEWRAELAELKGDIGAVNLQRLYAQRAEIEADEDLTDDEKLVALAIIKAKERQIIFDSEELNMQLRREFNDATLEDEIEFYEKQLRAAEAAGLEGTDIYIRIQRKLKALREEQADDAQRMADIMCEATLKEVEAEDKLEAAIMRVRAERDKALSDEALTAEARAAIARQYELEEQETRERFRQQEADELEGWTETRMNHEIAMGRATKQNLLDALKEVKRINDERGTDTEALARKIQLLEKEIADETIAQAQRAQDALLDIMIQRVEMEDEVAGALRRAEFKRDQALREPGLTEEQESAIWAEYWLEVERIGDDARKRDAESMTSWTRGYMEHLVAIGQATKEELLEALKNLKDYNRDREIDTEELARAIELLEKELADDKIAHEERVLAYRRQVGALTLDDEIQYWRKRLKAAEVGTNEYYEILSRLHGLEGEAAREKWRLDSNMTYRVRRNLMDQLAAELAALDTSIEGWETRAAVLREMLNKFREDEKHQVEDWLRELGETALRELGRQLKELGGLGEALNVFLSELRVEIDGMADGLDNVTMQITGLEEAIISLAIYGVGKLAEAFGKLFKEFGAEGDKWGKSVFPDLNAMIQTWEQWDELNEDLKRLEKTQTGTTIGGGLVGGLIGSLFGPIGMLVGAGIGAAI
ncbi:MAG TPA: phage tail tape measure protein, partial [Tepidimicrobium sp.]|nr:phage tail tape measure protein [Tepidimicrobium sp.]